MYHLTIVDASKKDQTSMPTSPRKYEMEKLRSDIQNLEYNVEAHIKSAFVGQYSMIKKEKRLAELEKSYQSSKRDGNWMEKFVSLPKNHFNKKKWIITKPFTKLSVFEQRAKLPATYPRWRFASKHSILIYLFTNPIYLFSFCLTSFWLFAVECFNFGILYLPLIILLYGILFNIANEQAQFFLHTEHDAYPFVALPRKHSHKRWRSWHRVSKIRYLILISGWHSQNFQKGHQNVPAINGTLFHPKNLNGLILW